MIVPDPKGWKSVAETSNTKIYEIEPRILANVPERGSSDTQETARANLAASETYWRTAGAGVVVIFIDLASSQDSGARRVYANELDGKLCLGTALVGGTLLGRAMMSFYVGIRRPRVPIQIFGNVDDALAWARGRLK
jgi:hypothetical protein